MLLFHHDNRDFSEGERIIGNHYDIKENILKKYQSDELFPNMQDVLYMTNRVRDSWDYRNVYQVVPNGKVVKCHTHYSVVLCQEEMKRCIDRFKKLEIRPDWSHDEIEKKYIHLMYEAYLGNSTAADTLDTYFGYDFEQFEEYEWICESANIKYVYVDYHDCIDSVCAASVMRPIFDVLYDIKQERKDLTYFTVVNECMDEVFDRIQNMFNF